MGNVSLVFHGQSETSHSTKGHSGHRKLQQTVPGHEMLSSHILKSHSLAQESCTDTPKDPSPSSTFLKLPLELRHLIYTHMLTSHPLHPNFDEPPLPLAPVHCFPTCINLLLLNRQIHTEVSFIFYQHLTFRLPGPYSLKRIATHSDDPAPVYRMLRTKLRHLIIGKVHYIYAFCVPPPALGRLAK